MTVYPVRRWASLAVLAVASVVIGLDTTVLNVALPILARDLQATASELQWFAGSYLLVMAVLLLPGGLLGDLVGRKPMTLTALAIFGASSAASAYAGSPAALIAARVAMGVGAALLVPLTYSWLIALFPDAERPKAMGVLGAAGFVGMPLGPILGGWLLDRYFWGSVFVINVPLVLLALVAGLVLLPGGGRLPGRRIDGVGIALSVVGLGALTYGMIQAPVQGWTDPVILLATAGGVAVLAAFVGWERRRPPQSAVMDMSLWRRPPFRWGTAAMTVATLLGIVAMFTMPQYFSAVLAVDALGSGLRLMPLLGGIVIGIAAGVALSQRAGYKVTVVVGLACITAGGLLAVRTGVDTGYGGVAAWLTLFGFGFGAVMIAGQNLALDTLDESHAGVGGAVVQVMRQTGSVIGIAVLGSLLNTAYQDHVPVERLPESLTASARSSVEAGLAIAQRLDRPDLALAVKTAFLDGVHLQMWLSAALAALGILGTLLGMPARLGNSAAYPAQENHVAPTDRSTPGTPLRIRKRHRTRRALQRAALDLVERNGYQATSVDEICDAAEVSRSTFFRYYGSKDAVFQSDFIEEEVIGLLDAPGKPSLHALEDRLCAGYQDLDPEDWDVERRRIHLLQTVPELRAGLLNEVFRPLQLTIGYVARMLDLPADSLRVRTVAGAIVGAIAARQLPDVDGNYELPTSTDDAIEMYRSTFRELGAILELP